MSEKRKEVERRILAFVEGKGEAIVAEVAEAVGIARGTARKHLAELVDADELERTQGGRDGGRKRPDRFSVVKGKRGEKGPSGKRSTAAATRLGPGELDGLVLGFLGHHRDGAPYTAGRIGKEIGRSSGAVANCLRRLEDGNQAALVTKRPREYDLPTDD